MNYKIPKPAINKIVKAVMCLTVFVGLCFAISKAIQPQESISALPSCTSYAGVKSPGVNCTYPSCATISSPNPGVNCLPNCATLSSSTSANPGVNCYYLDLPLCTATSYSVSVSDTGVTPSPRSNCSDLIDLPLCSQVTSSTSLKNCVNECNQTTDLLDTASSGHNVTCVRFCDKLPAGMVANPRTNSSAGNCVVRQCHKVDNNTATSSLDSNGCTKLACNLLTVDELNESRMQNEDDPYFAQYCDGSAVKCYSFSAAQLPYVRYRDNNTMCQIHSCKPATTSCGRKDDCTSFTLGSATTDDTQNISCNTTSGTDVDGSAATYSALYSKYINIGLPLTDNSLCTPVACRPVIYTPYPCSGDDSTVRNNNCDSSGDGSTCATTACTAGTLCKKDLGYCYKTIDCNSASNASAPECAIGTGGDSADLTDDTSSSFYRPVPLNKSYTDDKPSSDINDTSHGYRNLGACYSTGDLKNQSDNRDNDGCSNNYKWGCQVRFKLGLITINLGYFHMMWGPDDKTRSPGACNGTKLGARGMGYTYLCGNSQNLYSKVDERTAYHKGYIQTTAMDNGDSSSTVRVCLRFKNSTRPDDVTMSDSETCGSRECAISCSWGQCRSQFCGYDVCKNLTVVQSDAKQCALDNDMFQNDNDNRGCAAIQDNYLRVRAVQYGHKVCSFLDVKGTFAYNNMYFNGNEKLDDGVTCVSGTYDPSTGDCSNGKNTNDDKGLAERWRTIMRVRYTGGNATQNNVFGFYQKDGKFIKAQECAQVPLLASPPDLYNLANAQNTVKLFAPPLFIRSANDKRGGTAVINSSGSIGATDFLYPEIIAQFGTTTKTLSMGIGFSGYEVTKDPKSYALDSTAMTTTMNGITYKASVLIKKEYNSFSGQPTLCLYQRVTGSNGYSDIKIGCVNRTFPEINNAGTISATSIGVRKVKISGSTSASNVLTNGIYGTSSISLTYCADDSCSNTNILNLTNTDPTTPTCGGVNDNNYEKYQICAQREICSKLWKECMENEISIQNNGLTSDTNAVRNDCKNIASSCNARKGITSAADSLIDQAGASAGDPNAYGWFNELCIVSGFENKLGKVYEAISATGKGKCKLYGNSNETEEQLSARCPNGGNPTTGCNCLDASLGIAISGYNIRTQTPREAGLCVDMLTPQVCPAQNYGGNTYNSSSIDGTAYTDSNPAGIVNTQHRNRTISNVSSATGISGGHGEYPSAVVGMNGVVGTCNGFWTGAANPPKMSCGLYSGIAKWSGLTTSSSSAACVRYYCSAIDNGSSSFESDSGGNYSNSFYAAAGETADSINETTAASGNIYGVTYADVTEGTKGASNGYAIWAQFTKSDSSDFLQTTTASNCIVGYSGTLPTRGCNQLGSWKPVAGSCQRKRCSAIVPPFNPTNTNGNGAGVNWSDGGNGWTDWNLARGATFGAEVYLKNIYDTDGVTVTHYAGEPILNSSGNYITHLTPASRSATYSTPGSIRKGYCNQRLGYMQVGTAQPETTCQSDGTWSAIRNPCVTSCTAVTSTSDALNTSNGNATWSAITNVPIDGRTTCQAGDCNGGTCVNGVCYASGTCVSGYAKYPYTRLKDSTGTVIYPVPNTTASSSNIVDSSPTRACQVITTTTGIQSSKWSDTSSTCINKCPGYDVDTREGVGQSTYSTSQNGTVTIRWNSTNGGDTDIQTTAYKSDGVTVIPSDGDSNPDNNPFNKDKQDASQYFSGRTNGYFLVTRYCNPSTYTWSDPIIQCPKNGGTLNNSVFGTAVGSNPTTSTLLSSYTATNSSYSTSSCSTGYGNTSLPTYTCQAYSNGYLDQYYYALTSGSTTCTKIQCQAVALKAYGSGSKYMGATTYYDVGSSAVPLSCLNNFGHNIPSPAITNGNDSTCGRTAKDRVAAGPTMTCTLAANGTSASWVVSNDCTACRGCVASGYSYINSSGQNYTGLNGYAGCSGSKDQCFMLNTGYRSGTNSSGNGYACGNSGDAVTTFYFDNCASNTTCSKNVPGNECSSLTFTFTCTDGDYTSVSSNLAY